MKLISYTDWKAWDQATMQNQQISSVALMERASLALKKAFFESCKPTKEDTILIFCGVGNNGGDGLVIGRLLHQEGYQVQVVLVVFSDNYSEEVKEQLIKNNLQKIPIDQLSENNFSAYVFPKADFVIDAIFGYGLQRNLAPWIATFFQKLNEQRFRVIAIDVPSGMFLHQPSEAIIQSELILTIEQPKSSFFMPCNYPFAKKWKVVSIGLDASYLEKSSSSSFWMQEKEAIRLYRTIDDFSHKGTKGHVLLIGGSYGKMGAVYLAGKGAMHVGAGMLTAWVPKKGVKVLQTNFPEMMVITGTKKKYFKGDLLPIQTQAILIGPGWSTHPKTRYSFKKLLTQIKVPLVLDADAINILAMHPDWLTLIPKNTILTPHPKELERLIGISNNDWEIEEKTKQFAEKHQCIVVMKNARTKIVGHQKVFYFSQQNAKLATAGSGDVLAGIITGLLAQGYTAMDAACFGVYLHAKSATISDKSTATFMASDILEGLDNVFKDIEKSKTEC
jgi:hydroxyethylthiazole kinase-like uncharacterized protein yjeF